MNCPAFLPDFLSASLLSSSFLEPGLKIATIPSRVHTSPAQVKLAPLLMRNSFVFVLLVLTVLLNKFYV